MRDAALPTGRTIHDPATTDAAPLQSGRRDSRCSAIAGLASATRWHRPGEVNGEVRADMRKAANNRPRHKARRNKHAQAAHARARSSSAARPNHTPTGHAGRVVARRPSLFAAGIGSSVTSARNAVAWVREAPRACVRALPVAAEDREIFALLLAPFFILAVAIAGNQSLQLGKHLRALIARPVAPVALPTTSGTERDAALKPMTTAAPFARPAGLQPGGTAVWIRTPAQLTATVQRPDHDARPIASLATLPAIDRSSAHDSATAVSARATAGLATVVAAPSPLIGAAPPRLAASPEVTDIATQSPGTRTLEQPPAPAQTLALLGPQGFPALAAFDQQQGTPSRRVSLYERCTLASAQGGRLHLAASGAIPPPTWFAPDDRKSFGQRLAAAARRQLADFVVYDAAYRSIAYPRGDVPALYGVCTDVVIRAYRHLGTDLQVAVQKARVGSGDRNIDHRRTETLRRFFQRVGQSLPITTFAEDYLPGDIVTYARPQNTGTASRSHIAMVSDIIAPSGRPMIIHNRGWGPQLEDALFVDRITGHYRYTPHDATDPIGDIPPPDGPHRLSRQASAEPLTQPRRHGRAAPAAPRTLR